MKLSVGFFAGLAAADLSVVEPIKSLQRLDGFAKEIFFESGAFFHKSSDWYIKWRIKFHTIASRMEWSFGRKCGFYDADIHTFDYEYDAENACNGIKTIIDGFSRWSENHLSRCNGQKRYNHHQKRLDKWSDILTKVLDCKEEKTNSYTFVIPGDDWYVDDGNGLENAAIGESLEFSTLCNPDFRDSDGDDCEVWFDGGYCDNAAAYLIAYSTVNKHGVLETALNCPQCGCDANGAANLNDVYAEKGRKLSGKKN